MSRSNLRGLLREAWPVAAAAALALSLGIWQLGRQSFGVDEGVSAYTSTLPLDDILHFRYGEPNNALYFSFLFLWEKIGSSQEWLRLASVIAYALTVPLTAAIAWRSFGKLAGVAAAFLVATNAFALEMGQEARVFAILMALVSASTLLFILALERSTTRRWVLWAVVSVLAVYAHPFGSLVLIAQASSLAWLPPDRVPWRAASYAGGGVILAGLPLLVKLATDETSRIGWIGPATPGNVQLELERVLGSRGPVLLYLYGGLALVLIAIASRRRPRRSEEAWREILPALWLIVPILLAIAISQVQSMFYNRYLIVVLPAAVITVAAVLVRLRPPALAAGAVVTLFALHVPGVLNWYDTNAPWKGDWREAAAVIGPRAAAEETIFVHPLGPPTLAWYLHRKANGGPDPPPGSVAVVESASPSERAALSGTRVWLVEVETGEGFEPGVRQAFGTRPTLGQWDLRHLRVSLLGPAS